MRNLAHGNLQSHVKAEILSMSFANEPNLVVNYGNKIYLTFGPCSHIQQ